MTHRQVFVKVNASVDEGIAPLVVALNQLARIHTIDSCEGYRGKEAYVYFSYWGTARQLASFLHNLSGYLGDCLDSCGDYRLEMEWLAGTTMPTARIVCRRDYIGPLIEALTELAALRRSESGRDTASIGPRSSIAHRCRPQPGRFCDGTPRHAE